MAAFKLKMYKNIGFGVLTMLLIIVSTVAILTYMNRDHDNHNYLFTLAVQHHVEIMLALVIIATGFGFFWSAVSFSQIEKQKKDSKKILETVMLFLNREEKQIVNFLVEKKGATNQAEISRLPGMNRVKAYRSLQKMQEKRIIDIIPHGKIRRVVLKENILNSVIE